jgi:hypothetical protein
VFKGFGNLFGNRSTESAEESTAGDVFSELRWIEAADNPFGIRVLDCRPVVLGLVSTTTDPDIARRFLTLRSSTGTEHFGQVPDDAIHSDCDLTYPAEERPSDGPLFVADEMEDKWNIYLYSDYLYFTRSWTGVLVSRARLMLDGAAAHVDIVDVDRNTAADAALAVRHVDYLIKSHIYRTASPHPVPLTMQNERDIALYSFSTYGRRGQFASYEDTTRVKVF